MVSPTLFPSILDILIRFRSYPVSISSDISIMYQVVELCEEDRDYHRFLWRPDKDSKILDYRITMVTFGVASSPYVTAGTTANCQ